MPSIRQPLLSSPNAVLQAGFAVGLTVLLFATYWIYSPGLSGAFIFDDFWNLEPLGSGAGVQDWSSLRQFVFGNISGPTGRPVSMLSFLLDAQDWPANAAAFKATNIKIHLLTGAALCWLSLLAGMALGLSEWRNMLLALAVTAVWLLHPLNVSTTLYVVQRMTQLMALFSILALVCYCKARLQIDGQSPKALTLLFLTLCPFGLLAVLSKENGALLLLLIVVLEFTLFAGKSRAGLVRWWFRLGIYLPLLFMLIYSMLTLPASLETYATRGFTLGERLLTESRILLAYLREIAVPTGIGKGLFHDDYVVSRGLFNPLTTVFSLLCISSLLLSAFKLRVRQPVYALAVFWFFALHILESTYLPLELYFEHRNYLPMIGPLFAAGFYLLKYADQLTVQLNRNLLYVAVLIFIALSAFSTRSLALQWGNQLLLVNDWAQERPNSVRAQLTVAEYLTTLERPDLAMEEYTRLLQIAPNEVTILLQAWNHACQYGFSEPVTLREIVNNPQLVYEQNDIVFHLRALHQNLQDAACEFPELAEIEALFARIDEFAMPDWRQAALYRQLSDVYVHFRRLDPALINLTRAFEIQPRASIAVRQATLSASAGNYSDALIFLERARTADQQRNPLLPSAEDAINRLEEEWRAQLPTN